jgi:hypothetical protein
VRLVPLFEGELRFDEATEVGFPAHREDGDWAAYVHGDGRVSGDRIGGRLMWTNHPRRRADGTWLPDFQGVITTDDGAQILFSLAGYNQGCDDPYEYERRAALAAMTLATDSEQYGWVNRIFAVVEADVRPSADPEQWRLRAFECVNEITATSV